MKSSDRVQFVVPIGDQTERGQAIESRERQDEPSENRRGEEHGMEGSRDAASRGDSRVRVRLSDMANLGSEATR